MKNKRLRSRLEELEKQAGITDEPTKYIFLQFGGDASRAETDGRVWHKAAQETQEAFESRICAELPAVGPPVVVFFW
jgi:hypothetical protein